MEAFFILDSENKLVPDTPKVEKPKGSFRNVARKRLADITNLPQHPNEYIDRLKKENTSLMRLLADRDKNSEPSGIELQKLRLQNMQLAQANSEMLRELNSCKDKLKALRHELGCKNTLLKLISEGKGKNTTLQRNEVEVIDCEETCEEFPEADGDNNKRCHTKRRQRPKCLDPSVKQVHNKKKAENNRKQSARLRSEDPTPVEDLFEIADDKHPVCSLLDYQMHEDVSTSVGLPVNREGDSDLCHQAQVLGSLSTGRRRQAATKVQSYKEIPLNVKMRKPESEEPRHAEEFYKTDDAKNPECPSLDDPIHEDDLTSIVIAVNRQGDAAPCHQAQEFGRRSSRQAATKVQSYKEIPLNVKMRRAEDYSTQWKAET